MVERAYTLGRKMKKNSANPDYIATDLEKPRALHHPPTIAHL